MKALNEEVYCISPYVFVLSDKIKKIFFFNYGKLYQGFYSEDHVYLIAQKRSTYVIIYCR